MENVLIVIHLLIAIALVSVVLMQRTAQDGGGLMSGSSTMGGLFTARGSANLLTRTTAILATAFMVMSLLLGIIAAHKHKTTYATDVAPVTAPAKAESKPAEPAVPAVPVSK